ncbi:unnamed protein product, partial [Ceratitis capitata]
MQNLITAAAQHFIDDDELLANSKISSTAIHLPANWTKTAHSDAPHTGGQTDAHNAIKRT